MQIALDNAGIVLGQRDRECFNYLVTANRMMKQLEILHHPLHMCARNPKMAAICGPKDRAIEEQIRGLHQETYVTANQLWKQSLGAAFSELKKLNVQLTEIDRRDSIPIIPVVCPICGMKTTWKVDKSLVPIISRFVASQSPRLDVYVRLREQSLISGEDWNYSLELQQP